MSRTLSSDEWRGSGTMFENTWLRTYSLLYFFPTLKRATNFLTRHNTPSCLCSVEIAYNTIFSDDLYLNDGKIRLDYHSWQKI